MLSKPQVPWFFTAYAPSKMLQSIGLGHYFWKHNSGKIDNIKSCIIWLTERETRKNCLDLKIIQSAKSAEMVFLEKKWQLMFHSNLIIGM